MLHLQEVRNKRDNLNFDSHRMLVFSHVINVLGSLPAPRQRVKSVGKLVQGSQEIGVHRDSSCSINIVQIIPVQGLVQTGACARAVSGVADQLELRANLGSEWAR
jgi:hypothetical protein